MEVTLKGMTRTDIYTYIVSDYQYEYDIIITFVSGKFMSVKYPFTGCYDRSQWRVLREIEKIIDGLEKVYEEANKVGEVKEEEYDKFFESFQVKESEDNG